MYIFSHLLNNYSGIARKLSSSSSSISSNDSGISISSNKSNTILYSIESQFKSGGLGDLISETFNRYVNRIGLDRKFLTNYGSYNDLREDAGISKEQILNKLL